MDQKKRTNFLLILTVCTISTLVYGQDPDLTRLDSCIPLNISQECLNISSCATLKSLDMYDDYINFNCYCDHLCQVYGDCCGDAQSTENAEEKDYMQLDSETFTCESFHGFKDVDVPVYFVNRCPSDWEDGTISELCHSRNRSDIFRTWPVSDKRGATFTNVYCAQCHGVDSMDILYYAANFTCEESVDKSTLGSDLHYINKLITGNNCVVKYKRFSYMKPQRACKPDIINTCEVTNDLCLIEQCLSDAAAYVYGRYSGKAYKNKACALCAGDMDPEPVFYLTCDENEVHKYPMVKSRLQFFSLSLLLDLNGGTGTMVGHGTSKVVNKTVIKLESCSDGFVYDPFINRCRFIVCKSGFHYINGQCLTLSGDKWNSTDCVRHSYKPQEFQLFLNESIYINATSKWFHGEEYHITLNGDLLVCSNLTQNYSYTMLQSERMSMFKFDKVQTILSTVGQIISIVCLTIHLIVYSLLPQLRNLAGKNLMCLVGALLGAQLLFLVGVGRTSNYGLCVFFAIAIHYGFLAAFVWMHIMSFDIWRTFTRNTTTPSPDSQERRSRRYFLYGWLAPAIILVIGIVVNFADPNGAFRPGYGEGLCWITLRYGLIIFFAVPLAIILIFNVVYFILTAYAIHRISETTKIINKDDSDKRRFFLYIKLSVLMGLTWSFGFIATLADAAAVWYVFVIFNSLQGAFICFAFVFTRKVLRLLRERRRSRDRQYGRQESSNPSDQTSRSSSLLSKTQTSQPKPISTDV